MLSIDEKFNLAVEARSRSYSPYSKFAVGAVLIFDDKTYVYGCNIENSSYGLANCAERTAMFSAIAQGYDTKKAVELVIIADAPRPVSPCGACRQVMSELLNPTTKVTLFNMKKEFLEYTVDELIPYVFTEEDMNGTK